MGESDARELKSLLVYLKEKRGFDFSGYKTNSLVRRLSKRMKEVEINDYSDYIDYLEVHPEEFSRLFDTILINVTNFFRDPDAWKYLEEEVLPKLVARKRASELIRIWSTGCASGQEAYSIAMLLCEVMGEEEFKDRVKIYATDVDEHALNQARQALYTQDQVQDVPRNLLEKYFYQSNEHLCLNHDLRRNVIFGKNDLVNDAPISRLDLLVCRNTLMYFNVELQAKIMNRFHFTLKENGVLFLGKAEMLLTHSNLFTPLNLKLRFFTKVNHKAKRDKGAALPGEAEGRVADDFHLALLKDAALEASTISQLLLDTNNILVFANEQARQLFGLNRADLGRPFQDLKISYRPIELRSRLEMAKSEGSNVVVRDVEIINASGVARFYDIRIQPLGENSASISFVDITAHKNLHSQLEQTNHELETAMEELQSTNEELETTNEELQSTIEELETTNEELQASNEELETINEELQSTNEELQTINDELITKTEELNKVNNFMEAVLTSLQSAVVVLDPELKVIVWNRQAEDYWGLREDEVQGRNFLNLDIGLPVERLKKPFFTCLENGDNKQKLVLDALNRRGKKIRIGVMCSLLQGIDGEVQGIIALMDDLDRDGAAWGVDTSN